MSNIIEEAQLKQLLASPVFSILIDETTDVSVINEMVIYSRFITSEGEIRTVFLKIVELPNGCAETIEQALIKYLESCSLPMQRLVGFGSDGASVMTGRLNGVAARLKKRQPILTMQYSLCSASFSISSWSS